MQRRDRILSISLREVERQALEALVDHDGGSISALVGRLALTRARELGINFFEMTEVRHSREAPTSTTRGPMRPD